MHKFENGESSTKTKVSLANKKTGKKWPRSQHHRTREDRALTHKQVNLFHKRNKVRLEKMISQTNKLAWQQ